jgi:hypothetical protein
MKYDKDGKGTHSTMDEGFDFFVTDKYNKKYHFKIGSFSIHSHIFYEALEIVEEGGEDEAYKFHMLADVDGDPEHAVYLMKAKIKKGIDKRYLEFRDGEPSMRKDKDELFGRIDVAKDPTDDQFKTVFIIDGKKITIEELIKMLEPYTCFNFRLTMHDLCDDLPD